jgi:hypothetical protein
MDLSPDDTVYPVAKIALVLDALLAEGVPKEDALASPNLAQSTRSTVSNLHKFRATSKAWS